VVAATAFAARARLNWPSRITSQSPSVSAASADSRSWVAGSPASSAASAPGARQGTISTPGGNSRGMEASVPEKLASRPTRRPTAQASSIAASFGFNTGIGARSRAQASMQGPNAEQENNSPAAPVPAA